MINQFLGILLVLAIVGCGKQTSETGDKVALDVKDEQTSTVKNDLILIMKSRLKDPDSAKFQNVNTFFDEFILDSGNSAITRAAICGQVNSKNSYGGYAGFNNFIVDMPFHTGKGSYNQELLEVFIDDKIDKRNHAKFTKNYQKSCRNKNWSENSVKERNAAYQESEEAWAKLKDWKAKNPSGNAVTEAKLTGEAIKKIEYAQEIDMKP